MKKYFKPREVGEGNPHVLGMDGGDELRMRFAGWDDALHFVKCAGGLMFYYSGEWYLRETPVGVVELYASDDVVGYIQ